MHTRSHRHTHAHTHEFSVEHGIVLEHKWLQLKLRHLYRAFGPLSKVVIANPFRIDVEIVMDINTIKLVICEENSVVYDGEGSQLIR